MEQNIRFDQDLLNLFSKMIDDRNEKLILELLFTKKDVEEVLDELIKLLERGKDD
jgi:hypothetical protein